MELAEIELSGLDLSVTGFSIGEVDVLREMKIEGIAPYDPVPRDPVTRLGDVWVCGTSRICCGDTLSSVSLDALMADERADVIISDLPYNTSNAMRANRQLQQFGEGRRVQFDLDTIGEDADLPDQARDAGSVPPAEACSDHLTALASLQHLIGRDVQASIDGELKWIFERFGKTLDDGVLDLAGRQPDAIVQGVRLAVL